MDEGPADAAGPAALLKKPNGEGERKPGLWSIQAWRFAFPASVISRLGDVIFDITVVLWISTDIAAGKPWAPLAVSGVLVAAAIPVLLIGPVAGVAVDRVDRHSLMVRSNWVQTASIGSLVAVPILGGRLTVTGQLTWIYLAIIVSSAAGQFFQQARLAMIVKTVPDDLRTTAYSVQGSASSILSIAGPPLAAPLLFTAGVTWALAINAFSFLASSILLGRTVWDSAPDASGREGLWRSLNEGRKAIAANKVVLAIVLSITVVTLGTGTMTVLEVFFVTRVLHEHADLLGILLLAFAVGTLAGTAAAPRLERRVEASRLYVWGLILTGLGIVVFSRTTSFVLALVVYVVVAFPIGAVNTVLSPLVIRSVPREQLGRAVAFVGIFQTLAQLVSMAVTGWLVSSVLSGLHARFAGMTFGPVDTVFTVGGLLILVSGLAVWRPISAARAAAGAAAAPATALP